MIISKQVLLDKKAVFLKKVLAGFLIALLLTSPVWAADNVDQLAGCANIVDDAARLQCYDKFSGRKNPAPKASLITTEKKPVLPAESAAANLSMMTQHWDLDRNNRKHNLIIRPYRPNYFLPVAYNSSPNQNEQLDVDPNGRAQHNEAKFQLSFKLKAWEDLFDQDIDLWIAYTQLSFWQLYNSAFSSPFRDTNYEPEFLVNFRTDYELLGLKGRFINVGLNHQSNGRSRPLSRSWNRFVINAGLEKDNFGLLLKTWWQIPENEETSDNPDICKYMGYGELWGTYLWNRHKFAVMVRNNLRSGNNLGAVQLEWNFPLPFVKKDWFKGYIQYFNGYGESLLDYNQSINRISVGIALSDWQ
jgi:phospholipase A1